MRSNIASWCDTKPRDGSSSHTVDARIKASDILSGKSSVDKLSEGPKQRLQYYGEDFSTLTMPALAVYGDEDRTHWLTTSGAEWHTDTFALASGPKHLLVVKGGNRILGGISGWDVGENMEDSVDRLSIGQLMTWTYMHRQLYGDTAWMKSYAAFRDLGMGRVEYAVQWYIPSHHDVNTTSNL